MKRGEIVGELMEAAKKETNYKMDAEIRGLNASNSWESKMDELDCRHFYLPAVMLLHFSSLPCCVQ